MSTFNGEISEISGISVDFFENSNQKAYFLSHCHADHTKGLSKLQTKAPIYATPISALIIRRKCPHLEENIRILENGVLNSVELQPDDDHTDGTPRNFLVTAMSAGHCAGACQLLFQIEGCDILYTGDFRMALRHVRNIKQLEEIRNHSNLSVYLDSTFMKSSFASFPTQTESVRKVVEIVNDFLQKSKSHKVLLKVPARYGYEYLLMELSKKLGEKISIVEPELFEQYSLISHMDSCITNSNRTTRISLRQTYITETEEANESDVFLSIHLSAMFWKYWRGGSFVEKTSDNAYRVCYATHNSLNEIRDFLHFLKPKNVYLNVVPSNATERNTMLNLLAEIQCQYQKENSKELKETSSRNKFSFKKLRSLANRKTVDSKSDVKKRKL